MAGSLVVVGTPIGNLGDLSQRAHEALAGADAIACEDTRRTGRLLQMTGVGKRPLLVANEHTEVTRSVEIIERIASGETIALVSDAGMPGISDPGERLVRAVVDAGLHVDVVPGPTAMTTALVLSGLGTRRFVFEGFLPRKGRERTEILDQINGEVRTVVLYESPKRVSKTLVDLAEACGPTRRGAVARELTKLHEEVARGTLAELVEQFDARELKGEVVLVIDGRPTELIDHDDDALRALLRAELEGGASRRDAVNSVLRATSLPKRRIYDLANALPGPG